MLKLQGWYNSGCNRGHGSYKGTPVEAQIGFLTTVRGKTQQDKGCHKKVVFIKC